MENEVEDIASTNDEQQDDAATDASNSETDTTEKYSEREKQLYARTKKAEAELKELKESKTPTEDIKPGEFGYDVKAYLKSSGIKANEFDFVKKELKASGADLDTLLENEYFQAKLEKHRAIAKSDDATPSGKRSGGVAVDSVDYWLAKPIADVPQDMRAKVVNAKLEREKNKGVFYNS